MRLIAIATFIAVSAQNSLALNSSENLPPGGLLISGLAEPKPYGCDFRFTLSNELVDRVEFISASVKFERRGITDVRRFSAEFLPSRSSRIQEWILPLKCDDETTISIASINVCQIGGKSFPVSYCVAALSGNWHLVYRQNEVRRFFEMPPP